MTQYPSPDIQRVANGALPGGALITHVEVDSPAYDAGFEAGCVITAVEGHPLRDIIDWRWYACDEQVDVSYVDLQGDTGTVTLWREAGEDWGLAFDGVVFDDVRQCKNNCTFCFMRQLPKGMRRSLYLRDDDFRLSFLAGTFVTLTNITPEDEQRIIQQRISPLRVSLQATDADVRTRIIGKHANHGLQVLDRLLAAGIQFHAQVVLVPQQNDEQVLSRTLQWAYERPGILSVGIVPLGYTRHQQDCTHSFNKPQQSAHVLQLIQPFQQQALQQRGTAWVYAADEFYRNAYGAQLLQHLPPASFYGDYELFEDGIGIIRSTVDDWYAAIEEGLVQQTAEALRAHGTVARMVVGKAQYDFLEPLRMQAGIDDCFQPLYVPNEFFGGNVDVTGLLTGSDIAGALQACEHTRSMFFIPRVVFNDDGLTLDDFTLAGMEMHSGVPLRMVSCSPLQYFQEMGAQVRAEE